MSAAASSSAASQPAVQVLPYPPPKEALLCDLSKAQWVRVSLANEIEPTIGWVRQQLLRALKLTAEPAALRLWACSEVDRALLGSDKDERELSYYTLDGWLAFEVLQAPVWLFIKQPTGKTVGVLTQLSNHVATLKCIIAAELGVPVQEQRLVTSQDRQLQDDKRTLADYHIKAESLVQLAVRARGGAASAEVLPNEFVNLENTSGLTQRHFNPKVPVWRTCAAGLNLEGYCTNVHCAAYNELVIMPVGTNLTWDVLEEAFSKCPSCQRFVKPITCGFVECKWKWTGKKAASDGQPARRVKITDYQEAPPSRYTRFDPSTVEEGGSGMASWLSLRFLVKAWCGRSQCPASCGICSVLPPLSPKAIASQPDGTAITLLFHNHLYQMVHGNGDTTELSASDDDEDESANCCSGSGTCGGAGAGESQDTRME